MIIIIAPRDFCTVVSKFNLKLKLHSPDKAVSDISPVTCRVMISDSFIHSSAVVGDLSAPTLLKFWILNSLKISFQVNPQLPPYK